MHEFNVSEIRNIALISQVGTGKTSIADAMLFNAKENTRLGRVADGSSLMDFDPEEISHKITISTSIASFNWQNCRFNIIDTPGSPNFSPDSISSLQAADSALIVLDSVDGIKTTTSKLIRLAEEIKIPVSLFINKLDRENSNYKGIISQLDHAFKGKIVQLQIPVGEGESFKGVVDLIKMKMINFEDNNSGNFTETEIPQDIISDANIYRDELIELIVECDDALLSLYLEGQQLSEEQISKGLKQGIFEGKLVPVLFGSATKNFGIQHLLKFGSLYLPSPKERGDIKVITTDNNEKYLQPDDNENLSALVFKTIADPYTGQLTLLRIFSGSITTDTTVFNTSTQSKERVGQVFHLIGKKHDPVQKAVAGDIIAIAKLKDTHTGNTLCNEKYQVTIPVIPSPAPVISFTITPKSKGDEEKIHSSLKRLMEEDTGLKLSRDSQTNEMIISGMSQVHLDIAIERLKRKFGVDVSLATPKIPYRETITASSKVQGKYKKQSGGKGQYGDCWIELHPIDKNTDLEFIDKIVGGAIPRQYIPAIETGIREAMKEGVVAGYPVVGVQAVLFDGSYHPVDSSEMAFKVAGSMAFKKGAIEAKPVLLEPIMHVEISVSEEYTGDIVGNLNSRRGKMLGIDVDEITQIIKAEIPMAEMLKYSADLNSMTSGSGSFTMEFSHYEEVPAHIAQKIIEQSKKIDVA